MRSLKRHPHKERQRLYLPQRQITTDRVGMAGGTRSPYPFMILMWAIRPLHCTHRPGNIAELYGSEQKTYRERARS
jgi:hypothetical protein